MSKIVGASKRLAKTRRGRDNSDDAAAAIKLLHSKWEPPQTLAFSALEQRRRLPLMSVLNFLAFNAPDSPPNATPVMCAARRGQAFKVLYAAAREGEVMLFGTPQGGGRRQQIDAAAFDVPLSPDGEDGIGPDWEAVPGERFAELRQNPDPWVWRDVYVDRSSLESWAKKITEPTIVPKSGPDGGRPSVMGDIETELYRWIADGRLRLKQELERWTPKERGWSKARIARALAAWCEASGGKVRSTTIERALPSKLGEAYELF
jgi:hypothetical protein